jgi:CheY-like chemotaxis protein
VVDDNHDAADALHALLDAMNQDVRTVYDGQAALDLVSTFRPDVILLDIGMPRMSGYEVAEKLRQSATDAPVPTLVAVTGWGQEADRIHAREAGFSYHFVKPVSDDDLKSMLVEVSKRRGRRCGAGG